MNKVDITISHIESCEDLQEALAKIQDPIKGFGYKLTKNEINFCRYYAFLYFNKHSFNAVGY